MTKKTKWIIAIVVIVIISIVAYFVWKHNQPATDATAAAAADKAAADKAAVSNPVETFLAQ